MKITLSKKSKIVNVDFENLEFGKIFTDHIFVSKYSNGQWNEDEIMPYGDFLISPSARVFIFMIICCASKSYYGDQKIKVKIEEKYSRAAKGGVGYAKAAGNYAAQFYPTLLAKNEGYQQIIWTDSNKHKSIEEAGTMNLFFRIKNK